MSYDLSKCEVKTLLPSNVRVGDYLGKGNVYFEVVDVTYGFDLYHITFKIPTGIPTLATSTKEQYAFDEIIAYEHSPVKIKRFSLKHSLCQL